MLVKDFNKTDFIFVNDEEKVKELLEFFGIPHSDIRGVFLSSKDGEITEAYGIYDAIPHDCLEMIKII